VTRFTRAASLQRGDQEHSSGTSEPFASHTNGLILLTSEFPDLSDFLEIFSTKDFHT